MYYMTQLLLYFKSFYKFLLLTFLLILNKFSNIINSLQNNSLQNNSLKNNSFIIKKLCLIYKI